MASKIPAKKQKSKAPKSAKAPNTSWYAGGKLTYLFIALGATLLVFLNALDNGFVNWDDNVNIQENPNLRPSTGTASKASSPAM